jgi:hypothetical protein
MKNNTYYDNILRKVLTETLEDRADEIMEKLKFNKPGSSFDYVEEGETCEQCGSSEMTEGDCMECGYSKGEVMEYNSLKDASQDEFSYLEEFCSYPHNIDHPDCADYYHYTSKLDDESGEEIKERLHGNQHRIDKNKNGRIDREDFKMLRSRSEMKEDTKEKTKKETEEKRKKKDNPFKTDPDIKENPKAKVDENVFYKLEYINESALFTEEEIIDIIEAIIVEESNIKKGKSPAGYAAYEKSHKGSGKEEDDYMKELSKKMIDYLKDGSKGKYEMNPKHFPVGNGEMKEMDKKAFEISDENEDFNYEIAGLNIPIPDAIQFDDKKMDKHYEGSSETGNKPGGNALESKANARFNKLRKKKTLHKLKDQSYNRVPSPVYNEKSGTEKGGGINIKLESVNEKQTQKLNEEFDRMKGLIGYDRKTQ